MSPTKKIPSPIVSLFPIIILIGMLFATIRTFGSDALNGGSQVSLLTTTAVCIFIGITFYRIPWKDYEIAITNNIAGVSSAIIILLIIGALSGAWMISGVVPTLIYYGMKIIHPDFFLTSTCIICALVSIMTGSSWTTIATIGIALLGIGKAQGFEEGWIARKMPSIITLFLSTLLAAAFAIIFQPDLLYEISGSNGLFKGTIMSLYGSTSLQSDSAMLTELIATRGMAGMMNTIWLILCAMCFGGAMTASGMLGSITSVFVRFMKSTVSVVASTVGSGLFLNLATADQYISIILTGNMFSNIYEKKGYESRLLSRTTEDAVTVTSVLIPWNTCGMTQATILSVSTLTYLPYCFFNLISPLMSILIAATGYKIIKKTVNNPG